MAEQNNNTHQRLFFFNHVSVHIAGCCVFDCVVVVIVIVTFKDSDQNMFFYNTVLRFVMMSTFFLFKELFSQSFSHWSQYFAHSKTHTN